MKKILLLLFLASEAAFGQQFDSFSESKKILALFVSENYAEIMASVDSSALLKLDSTRIKSTWEKIKISNGKFLNSDSIYLASQAPFEVVIQRCVFEKKKLNFRLMWGKDDKKIHGIYFLPIEERQLYKSPAYVDTSKFTEEKVMVITEDYRLPGTLTVPKSSGKHAAVILLQGAGVTDRDETIGATKIFKDIANGLSTQNITVLRYEKRLRVYRSKLEHRRQWTVNDEMLADIPAAISLLKTNPAVDTNQIFILGHGLGAALLPKVVQSNPIIKGIIMLAPHARKLESVYASQTIYVANETIKDEMERKNLIDSVKAVQVKVQKLTDAQIDDSLHYFQSPSSYWIDLHKYNMLTTASSIQTPVLLQFALRDYQTTMEDVDLWQKALKAKKNADFKMYPKLNHFFIAGEGKSLPEEYEKPGNVDFSVISDIAAWIAGK